MSFPLPVAQPKDVERIQLLYRTEYGVMLEDDEAKRLLEGVMQFIYLTQLHDALHSLRQKIE